MFDLCSLGNSVYWEERRVVVFLTEVPPTSPRDALTQTKESGAQGKGSTDMKSPARFLKDVWVPSGGGGSQGFPAKGTAKAQRSEW